MPCCAVLYSAEPAWPGELPASARGEALIPGWARGNCLSAGCSLGTAGMQRGGAAPLSPLNSSPLLCKGEGEPPMCQAVGQRASNGGCRLEAVPASPGGPWLTRRPPRHLLFCRDLPQSAAAEAEEQPKQHGVACQREPGEHGPGTDGEAPVLCGPLSWPGTPGSPRGPPQPQDTPVA